MNKLRSVVWLTESFRRLSWSSVDKVYTSQATCAFTAFFLYLLLATYRTYERTNERTNKQRNKQTKIMLYAYLYTFIYLLFVPDDNREPALLLGYIVPRELIS